MKKERTQKKRRERKPAGKMQRQMLFLFLIASCPELCSSRAPGRCDVESMRLEQSSIKPSEIEVDFDETTEVHSLQIQTALGSACEGQALMIHVGNIDEPYDRPLPVHIDFLCHHLAEESVVQDNRFQEEYMYGCCGRPISCNTTRCLYNCPISKAPPPDIFDSLGLINLQQVWLRPVANGSASAPLPWHPLSEVQLHYHYAFTFEGTLKRGFTVAAVLFLIASTSSRIIEVLNHHAFENPGLFLLMHVLLTFSMMAWLTVLNIRAHQWTDSSGYFAPRQLFLRAGLGIALTSLSPHYFLCTLRQEELLRTAK